MLWPSKWTKYKKTNKQNMQEYFSFTTWLQLVVSSNLLVSPVQKGHGRPRIGTESGKKKDT